MAIIGAAGSSRSRLDVLQYFAELVPEFGVQHGELAAAILLFDLNAAVAGDALDEAWTGAAQVDQVADTQAGRQSGQSAMNNAAFGLQLRRDGLGT